MSIIEGIQNENNVKKVKKALVAEDNEINLKLCVTLLGLINIEAIGVLNGSDALNAFNKEEIDIILLDIQMPKINGLELCKIIRSTDKGKEIPIIAVTAYAMESDKDRCILEGMTDYIAKPYTKNQFLELIRKYIQE